MRNICWFSCGAASAVATKIMLKEDPEAIVAYTEVVEEHEDNKRFLKDCENWFGKEITILRNEKYNGSIYEVFRKVRYLKGPSGAACTRLLKKKVREMFQEPTDTHIFGFTVEEQNRVDRIIDANNDTDMRFPLIEKGLSKSDVLAMIENVGIELPMMYKMGYSHNNCIGCVKGEAGYWNKIRVDFPEVFERMAKMEEYLGRTVTKIAQKDGTYLRPFLRELPPDAGRLEREPDIECSIFCQLVEDELND